MASSQANKRLTKEFKYITENPVDLIQAHPSESNILEWHFIITGPPDTPYFGGKYHGMLKFPPQYPFKPPGIQLITPNGRFLPKTRICLSMSDYHPETWNPAWKVSTILTALLSFMTGNENASGCTTSTPATKQVLAKKSQEFNKNNPIFQKQFPEFCMDDSKKKQEEIATAAALKLKEDEQQKKEEDLKKKKDVEFKKKQDDSKKRHDELKRIREAARQKQGETQVVEILDDDDIVVLDDEPTDTEPIVID